MPGPDEVHTFSDRSILVILESNLTISIACILPELLIWEKHWNVSQVQFIIVF